MLSLLVRIAANPWRKGVILPCNHHYVVARWGWFGNNRTMAEIVNLRLARKARSRAKAAADAAENRARHGMTAADRKARDAEAARIARTLAGAEREDG